MLFIFVIVLYNVCSAEISLNDVYYPEHRVMLGHRMVEIVRCSTKWTFKKSFEANLCYEAEIQYDFDDLVRHNCTKKTDDSR